MDARLGRAGLGLDYQDGEGEGGEGIDGEWGIAMGMRDGNRENIESSPSQLESSQIMNESLFQCRHCLPVSWCRAHQILTNSPRGNGEMRRVMHWNGMECNA